MMMDAKYLEKIVKGFANHHRIRILELVAKEPNLTLLDITDKLKINFRTASEHTRKLVGAGLLLKKYKGTSVEHRITDRGKLILKFCRILE